MKTMASPTKGTRIVVTGGAGFIGSELLRQLAATGAEVVAVDNLVNGKRENIEGVDARLAVEDIRNTGEMERLLGGVDVVFHLACLGVRHSIHSPRENHDVNATATLALLSLARAAGVKRFVYVSSSEVYGTARSVPITEEHPTFPKTVYGAGKLAGECYARAFHDTYGFATVVIRPFNTYGPRCHHEGDSGEVIPKFLLRTMAGRPMIVFGDGTQTRDFTYVSDTAAGILAVGCADEAVGKTINLGSGLEISINDLALKVQQVLQLRNAAIEHMEPRPGDVLRLSADIGKARRLIQYQPAVSLPEGLARLHQWYVAQDTPPEKLLEKEVVRNWRREESTNHA
jgi:UDP-glucose 4-epimerase